MAEQLCGVAEISNHILSGELRRMALRPRRNRPWCIQTEHGYDQEEREY